MAVRIFSGALPRASSLPCVRSLAAFARPATVAGGLRFIFITDKESDFYFAIASVLATGDNANVMEKLATGDFIPRLFPIVNEQKWNITIIIVIYSEHRKRCCLETSKAPLT